MAVRYRWKAFVQRVLIFLIAGMLAGVSLDGSCEETRRPRTEVLQPDTSVVSIRGARAKYVPAGLIVRVVVGRALVRRAMMPHVLSVTVMGEAGSIRSKGERVVTPWDLPRHGRSARFEWKFDMQPCPTDLVIVKLQRAR